MEMQEPLSSPPYFTGFDELVTSISARGIAQSDDAIAAYVDITGDFVIDAMMPDLVLYALMFRQALRRFILPQP